MTLSPDAPSNHYAIMEDKEITSRAELIRNNFDKILGDDEKKDPKKGTGKKPKGSSRRLYTDEDPKDTVGIKFSTRQDIVDTLNKTTFKNKSHARKSQVINLIDDIKPVKQLEIKSKYYPKRTPEDSRLDPNKTFLEQFNLLRVADKDRYPSFFEYLGHKYIVIIQKG